MNKKTREALAREALEGSIKKWLDIVNGDGKDEGTLNCPLCKEFNWYYKYGACTWCPVSKDTCYGGCDGTPYDAWLDHHEREHNTRGKEKQLKCYECVDLAADMVEYLRSLREWPNVDKVLADIANTVGVGVAKTAREIVHEISAQDINKPRLTALFLWNNTPQGHKYWEDIHHTIEKMKAKKHPVVDLSMLEGNDWLLFNFWNNAPNMKREACLAKIDSQVSAPYKIGRVINNELEKGIGFRNIEFSTRIWYSWFGGPCPLPDGVMVEVMYRSGSSSTGRAVDYNWKHYRPNEDIIAFRIIGLADGLKYGLEVDGD